MKHSSATCHGAISAVNALTTGLGAAIGIKMNCRVTATFESRLSSNNTKQVRVESDFRDRHNLLLACVKRTLAKLNSKIAKDEVIRLTVKSEIPPAVGLKSSSAVSIATVKGVANLIGGSLRDKEVLDLSCLASKSSRASITGAYDDASACLLGGLVLTNNHKFETLKRSRIPDHLGKKVLIRIPQGKTRLTSSVHRSIYSKFRMESMKAFEYAMQGEIYLAMMLNTIVQCTALDYPFQPVASAVNAGATAVGISGKGPALAALCRSNRVADRIKEAWSSDKVRIIRTEIVQPAK